MRINRSTRRAMMRNVLISLAAAASALAVASPASAQYYPQPPQPQGYGWGQQGANANFGQVRRLHNRVQQIRQRIGQLQRVHRLSAREARRLDAHAVALHRRIDLAARRGLHPRERVDIQRRTEALRHAVRYEARNGNRWGWNGFDRSDNSYGYYGSRHRDDDRRRDRRDDWDDWDNRWDRDRD
jgi:Spy/CpxP family protein refolding chaperone